jgi:hypothetical protein
VSSDYRLLCLTHDPALEIGDDRWPHLDQALAAVADPAADPLLVTHPGCDLLIGRYSYPLVEVICPPKTSPSRQRGHLHRDPHRIDAAWLRLLWHATASTGDGESEWEKAARNVPDCWRWERVHRLRYALGIVSAPAGATCCQACDKASRPAPDVLRRITMPTPTELGYL